MFVFEKAQTYKFTPLAGGVTVAADTHVSTRFYTSKPSTAQMDDHLGALIGDQAPYVIVTDAWTNGNEENAKLITIPAFSDPDSESNHPYRTMYVVTSFKYDAGGNTVRAPESIRVYRPDAVTSRISITGTDVSDMDSEIYKLVGSTKINNLIKKSVDRVFKRYLGLGFERAYLDAEDLNNAALYKTLQMAAFSLPSDTYIEKAKMYKDEYEEIWAQEPVDVDLDEDQVFEGAAVDGSVQFLGRF